MSTSEHAWLALSQDQESVTVTLSRPTEINGVKQDRITLRTPTVADLRNASKHSKGDVDAQDIFLFASLAECAPADIERLSIKDYNRIKEGYFRLVND